MSQLREAASRRITLTGAKCTTMLNPWLLMSLLLFSGLSVASPVGSAGFTSAFSALELPCRTLDLRRAGRKALSGQSAMSTLAPGTEASMTCGSSQPTSASGEEHGIAGAATAAGVLLMTQHPATVVSDAC